MTPSVEIPKDTANGDYTTTFCLAAAKAMKMNPRQVAQILTEQMDAGRTPISPPWSWPAPAF